MAYIPHHYWCDDFYKFFSKIKMKLLANISVRNPKDMVLLGSYVAQSLSNFETIYLVGELGAGKTMFAKGVGSALSVREEILSPTFVLQREYEGSASLQHFDLYRLSTLEELTNLNFFDSLGKPGIKLVEWADRFPEIARFSDLVVQIKVLSEGAREVTFYA